MCHFWPTVNCQNDSPPVAHSSAGLTTRLPGSKQYCSVVQKRLPVHVSEKARRACVSRVGPASACVSVTACAHGIFMRTHERDPRGQYYQRATMSIWRVFSAPLFQQQYAPLFNSTIQSRTAQPPETRTLNSKHVATLASTKYNDGVKPWK